MLQSFCYFDIHLIGPQRRFALEDNPPTSFNSIGHVESRISSDHASPEDMRLQTSRLVVRPELEPGLMGLDVGQPILVLFHLHRASGYQLQLHPRHDQTRPLRGVFATRSQYRPNSIGATVARIQSIRGNIVTVTGLDAQDGSPILDIKPYSGGFDTPGGAAEPGSA